MDDFKQSYFLRADKFTYHANLTIMRSSRGILSAGLRVGGMRRGCIDMTYSPMNNHTLRINSIDYSEKCAVEGNLPRGTGTKHMVLTALSYMLQHPDFGEKIQHITLDDASSVPCMFKNNTVHNVSLMYLYIAMHGHTWYQSRFNAFIQAESVRNTFKTHMARMNDSTFKSTIQKSGNMHGRILLEKMDTKIADTLVAIFDKSITLSEFFQTIKSTYGDQLCVVTYRWLDRFMDEVVLNGCVNSMTMWELPRPKTLIVVHSTPTNELPVDVFPIKGGSTERLRKCRESHGNCPARYGWEVAFS